MDCILFSGKPSLRVLLCDELPLHDILQRTNVARFLRRTAKDDVGDASAKRFRFSAESKEQRVAALTKTFLADPSKFVDRVEGVVVEALRSNDLSNVNAGYLVDSVSSSKRLFHLLIQIFVRYATETNFEDRIFKIFRAMVEQVHEGSHHPAELYPAHLSKVVGLIHLNVKDEQTVRLLRTEMLNLILTDPVRAKVILLIFPGAFNLDFEKMAASKLSSSLFISESVI